MRPVSTRRLPRSCTAPLPVYPLFAMRALQSIYAWVGIVLLILLALPTVAMVRLFDRSEGLYTTGRVFRTLGDWITRVNPRWNVAISGRLPDNPRRPFVVVSNHQSNADIPAISRLPWEMKWVAKKALFDVPVVGWMMRMAGDIPVDRKDPSSRATRRSPREAGAGAARLGHVHARGHALARRPRAALPGRRLPPRHQTLGVPILPLAIDGTAEALPKHGWRFGTRRCADPRLRPRRDGGARPRRRCRSPRDGPPADPPQAGGVARSARLRDRCGARANGPSSAAPEASGPAPLCRRRPAARGEERAKTAASGA